MGVLLSASFFALIDDNGINKGIEPLGIKISGDNLRNILIMTIVFGAFVALVTFLGCCGAFKENKCMLTVYSVIVGCLFIALFAVFILALVILSTDGSKIEQLTKERMQKYYEDDEIRRDWDKIQKKVNIIVKLS